MTNPCVNPKCEEPIPAGDWLCPSCWSAVKFGFSCGTGLAGILGGVAGLLYGVWLSMP